MDLFGMSYPAGLPIITSMHIDASLRAARHGVR